MCPDADIAVCELVALTFVIDINETFEGSETIGAFHTLTLYADQGDATAPTIVMVDPAPGEHAFDLPLADWASHWDTYSVELTTDSSLFQVPSPAFSSYNHFWAAYYIRKDYLCINPATSESTHPSEKAYTKDPDDDTKCEPSTADLRALCYAGQGVGTLFYKSTPLSDCHGCTITDREFKPVLDATTKVDISSGTWCLCASGGSGNYEYGLSAGQLPCGMTLDPLSGCITGTENGKCAGTDKFTFNVIDVTTHESASVTCGILGTSCPQVEIIGNQAY